MAATHDVLGREAHDMRARRRTVDTIAPKIECGVIVDSDCRLGISTTPTRARANFSPFTRWQTFAHKAARIAAKPTHRAAAQQEDRRHVAGRSFAEQLRARCHRPARSRDGRNEPQAAIAIAPAYDRVAARGHRRLPHVRHRLVDLVLLYINMPRMDALELLERMRAENMLERVAVIMCSTSTYEEDITKAKELCACGYLTKPPDFRQLKSLLETSTTLELSGASDALLLLRAAWATWHPGACSTQSRRSQSHDREAGPRRLAAKIRAEILPSRRRTSGKPIGCARRGRDAAGRAVMGSPAAARG
jgi:CheY-like chemotaxis protein